jgi:preprotein translocase subunit SecE
MSKEKTLSANTFVHELFHAGVYKKSQGKVTRQITFAVFAISFGLAAWRLWLTMGAGKPRLVLDFFRWLGASQLEQMFVGIYPTLQFALPGALLFVGLWASYRIVNLPRFADFLIAVEAEMNKVSWPSRGELMRSSLVVIFVIFALAMILFGYDLFWKFLFQKLGIVFY